MEIISSLEGVSVREKKGKQLKYYIHLTEEMARTTIEALDLSQRAHNCLMRAGFNTVGDICEAVANGKSLMSLRNCGIRSVQEIQEKLFLLQYNSLSETKREAFLAEVVILNL